jgi:hypothetical protein
MIIVIAIVLTLRAVGFSGVTIFFVGGVIFAALVLAVGFLANRDKP